MGEIDLRIASLEETPAAGCDPADILPEVSAGPPVSKLGDLWLLGRHRVLCGNALDPEAFTALMGAERAAMVFTDPPYNVPIDGHASGLGAIHHRPFPMASGEMSEAEFTAFLGQACRNLAAFSADGSLHLRLHGLAPSRRAAGRRPRGLWRARRICASGSRTMPGWARSIAASTSSSFVFKQRGGRAPQQCPARPVRPQPQQCLALPGANSFARRGAEGNLLALHPTVKPVAMVADAILDCSARGDIVLDAFLGSGTTLIAAERTGRRCCGLELDPGYVDTAIRRWQGDR